MTEFRLASHDCEHLEVTQKRRPDGDVHWSDIRCASCGKHLGYGKKPANLEREARNRHRIAVLDGMELVGRPGEFIRSILRCDGKLSPKQQEWLDSIWEDVAT